VGQRDRGTKRIAPKWVGESKGRVPDLGRTGAVALAIFLAVNVGGAALSIDFDGACVAVIRKVEAVRHIIVRPRKVIHTGIGGRGAWTPCRKNRPGKQGMQSPGQFGPHSNLLDTRHL